MSNTSELVHRHSSTIKRELRSDAFVYVKQYLAGDWGRTGEVVQARTAREAALLARLAASELFGRRLGVLPILDSQPDQATLVMAEIAGQPLDGYLDRERWTGGDRRPLTAVYLAGKWLRQFQLVPANELGSEISTYESDDLVEYCDFRIQKLHEFDYRWPSKSLRVRILDTLEQLRAQSDDTEMQLVWSHGDYSPGNIMWDDRVLTPIDFGMIHAGRPLADVTYFIHRLEMQRVYRPWKRWPLTTWKRAFLRGYGRPNAEQSPMFRALMIRHLLCRVLTYVRRSPRDPKQALHDKWVRGRVRAKLEKLLGS